MHCEVHIAFTTDEVIGRGAVSVRRAGLRRGLGYTVDGARWASWNIDFQRGRLPVTVHGVNIHPGSARIR